jgi:hypothetical protein
MSDHIRIQPIARYRIVHKYGSVTEVRYCDDRREAIAMAAELGGVVEELLVDKAAIVAELERLSVALKSIASESRDPLSKALASGMSLGIKDAIRVVQAGGALPPESEKKVEGN